MREIKFRAWDKTEKDIVSWEQILSGLIELKELFNGNPDIVPMQYTGSKDKNGNEIYEGDVYSKGNIVEFSYGSFNINGDVPLGAICSKIEIIGNIYKNPELK